MLGFEILFSLHIYGFNVFYIQLDNYLYSIFASNYVFNHQIYIYCHMKYVLLLFLINCFLDIMLNSFILTLSDLQLPSHQSELTTMDRNIVYLDLNQEE